MILTDFENKSKTMWPITNSESDKDKNKVHLFNGINRASKLIYSPEEASNIFNHFFINVAKNSLRYTVKKLPTQFTKKSKINVSARNNYYKFKNI